MHASVVIKLTDEEEPDVVKMYKIDVEDVEVSKEYVVDELFCDGDLAVYAVFETSDITNGKPLKNFMKVSCSNFNELKLSEKRSVTKRKDDETWPRKSTFMSSDEKPDSFFEHRGDNLTYSQDSSNTECSPVVEDTKKCMKMTLTSKGINTDIGQSPRLLEEVQKLVGLTFSKANGKNKELSSVFTVKSSYDLRELTTRVSSTTFTSNEENCKRGNKSAPNIVIVPVLIKDEKLCNFWRDEEAQQLSGEKNLNSKMTAVLEKVSVSTSTEPLLPEHNSNKAPEVPHTTPDGNRKSDPSYSIPQENLMQEIKILQEKFSALLMSLESNGFTLAKKKIIEAEVSKPGQKSLNKFDNISIFSLETNFNESENFSENTTDNQFEKKVPPTASNSENITKDVFNNGNVIDERYDQKDTVNSSESISWREVENCRVVRLSKSQTNNLCVASKNTNLKKSLSMDLGGEAFGLKKLEKIFFKLEGSVKKENITAISLHEGVELVNKINEMKFRESPKLEENGIKSNINYYTTKPTTDRLLKSEKNKLIKTLQKTTSERPTTPNAVNLRFNNEELGEVRDTKIKKKTVLKSRITEKNNLETNTISSQAVKQKVKSVTRRIAVKESPQTKLPADSLVKSRQNLKQKNNTLLKSNPTRLPCASCQKKDQNTLKKENNLEVTSEVSVEKSLELEEIKNEARTINEMHSTSGDGIVVELFSKKPTSNEFYSEVDLQCLYSNEIDAKSNPVNVQSDSSNDSQNPVVKSVWALTKVLLYEDGTKKMEVLEASLNPPDYCFNQNLTEDKIR